MWKPWGNSPMPGKSMKRILVAACLLLALTRTALGEVTVDDPGRFVVDQAGALDAQTRQELEDKLKKLEQQTTAQVKLLTVKSLDDEEVFSFSQRHYTRWKLGQKGKDNGALIVLSLQPHRIRIHTGYGLEGALPDSWCGSISRRVAGQYFKQGRYSQGLRDLTLAVIDKVGAEYGIKPAAPPPQAAPAGSIIGGLVCVLFIVVFLIPLLATLIAFLVQRKGRRRWGGNRPGSTQWGPGWFDAFPTTSSSSWGGTWGSSGGFGGGSFGGGGSSGGGGGGASW